MPIAKQLAIEMLDASVLESTIKRAAIELSECYTCLSNDAVCAYERLSVHSRRFCTLLVALETALPTNFRFKPKVHLFQELAEMDTGTKPAAHWTFRDEEFGGTIAQMGHRRGGGNFAGSVSRQVLFKFIAKHKLPDIS